MTRGDLLPHADKGFALDPVPLLRGVWVTTKRGAGTCFLRCVLRLLKKRRDGYAARLIALRAVRSLWFLRCGVRLGVPPQTPAGSFAPAP